MKVTKIIYKCDICGTEVENENELSKVEIPIKELDCEGRSYSNSFGEVDMCQKCKNNYINSVYKNFGIYESSLSGDKFKKANN